MSSERIQIGGPIYPIRPVQGVSSKTPATSQGGADFRNILDKALAGAGELRFSAHATQRLEERGIHLTTEDMSKLQSAVDKAAAKGSRDALILMDDLGFIVNVKSRTVLTAVQTGELKEKVFTNIDSAVLVDG